MSDEEFLVALKKRNLEALEDGFDNGWWEEWDERGPIKCHVGLWKDWEGKTQAQAIVGLIQPPYLPVFKSITEAKKAGYNKPVECDSCIVLNKGRVKVYIDKD